MLRLIHHSALQGTDKTRGFADESRVCTGESGGFRVRPEP